MKSDSLFGNRIEIRITYSNVENLSRRLILMVYVINYDGQLGVMDISLVVLEM